MAYSKQTWTDGAAGATPLSAARLNNMEAGIEGAHSLVAALVPGIVSAYAGATSPAGWLLCNGAAVSRTTYASLFAAIGTAYGTGDGSTTFNLPDMRGRVPVGLDTAQVEFDVLGEAGGAKTHRLTEAESGLRDHAHVLPMGQGASVGSTSDVPARSAATGTAVDPAFRTGRIADSSIQANQSGTYNSAALTGATATTQAVSAHNNLQPYRVLNYIIKS